jgi:carbon monoxide dehydrogenase subunit G
VAVIIESLPNTRSPATVAKRALTREGFAMLRIITGLCVSYLVSLPAEASRLVRLDIDRKADIFEIQVEMEMDAPAENIRAVLTDYNNLDRLNASITTSRVVRTENGGAVRVLTRLENCVLFFCMDMKKVEDVTQDAQGRILVSIVPGKSSFRSGNASWEIRSTGKGSRVIHHARVEPDIMIPPLIGNSILKSRLRDEIMEVFQNLACMAHEQCTQTARVSSY